MYSPERVESPPASIRRGNRIIRKTKPIDALAGPVSEFEAAEAAFESRYDAWRLARQQASIATGAQHEAEDALDDELRGVGLAILTVDGGRRSSEVYRKYFPAGYGSTLRRLAAESLVISAGLITALETETSPDILARREPLISARARVEAATAARQAAFVAAGQAKALLQDGKLAWRKALNQFYFAARAIFSDRLGYVESLFRVTGGRRTGEEEEEGAGTGQESGTGTAQEIETGPMSVAGTEPTATPPVTVLPAVNPDPAHAAS